MNEGSGSPVVSSTRGFARLGEWCARRPGRFIASSLAVLLVIAAIPSTLHTTFNDNVNLSGTQASTGLVVLGHNVPGVAMSSRLVVFHSTSHLTDHESTIVNTVARLSRVAHVVAASNPWMSDSVSREGLSAMSTLSFDVP
jgi:uncharacterized membrane protein YdfJ with MMPL/SSD domain